MMIAASESQFAELDAWIARRLEHDGIPGLSLAITTATETIYVRGHGLADAAAKTPVEAHHLFEIGSVGKAFTAMLLLRMQERGQIDLHRPVTDYLPWFSVQSEYEPITSHHLLTHTAGLIVGSDVAADGRFETWYLRETEVSGPPGTVSIESNVGYKTLGYLIENVIGKNYSDAVTEEILKPLGMHDSITPITNRDRPRIATSHRRLHDDRPNRYGDPLVSATWIQTWSADGSIACTPGDYAIFARALMHRAADLVSEESFAHMIADYSNGGFDGDPDDTYGYGLVTWRDKSDRFLYGHGGSMVGNYSQLTIDPEAKIGVVGSVNGPASAGPYVNAVLDFTRALLAGETPELPEIRSRLLIDDADDYIGEYSNDTITCELIAENGGLVLAWEDQRVALEQRRKDTFWADHPALVHNYLVAERENELVSALHFGRYWLGKAGLSHAVIAPIPDEWSIYTGWYRCHNPWLGVIRILERRGALILVEHGYETKLFDLGNGQFRIGDAPSPERLTFDAIADGVALRANFNSQAYYRTPASSVESGVFVREQKSTALN
ncbi:hypothetical protein BH09CHL1_BH09CHL1_02600 [soil metagenome]